MALAVNLYNFSKRENSTKVPETEGETFSCVLRGACGVVAPSLQLTIANPTQYNYAYIPDFGRYYFIREWTYADRLWQCDLEVDVLASYKTLIGASTQYVTRSSFEWDGDIIDTLYPANTAVSETVNLSGTNPWQVSINTGYYVVGIINGDESGVGGVNYYALSQIELNTLKNYLFDTVDWLNIDTTEISKGLQKALFNPIQYISSCKWFPINLSSADMRVQLPFAWWEIPTSYRNIPALGSWNSVVTFNIAKHPQTSTRGNFLNASPFTRHTLYFPPFGNIALNPTDICNETVLTCNVDVDLISGMGILNIFAGSAGTKLIQKVEAMVGVPVELAQFNQNIIGAATSAIGAVGDLVTLDFVGAAEGVMNAITSAIPQLTTTGNNGTFVTYYGAPRLASQFYEIVDDSLEHRGRPLCKEKVINTIPGFIIVSDPDVSLPATLEENQRVKNYLSGGFYFE